MFFYIIILILLLCSQIAQHQGYIKVNWKKVNGDIEKAKSKLDKHSKKQIHSFIDEVYKLSV